MINTRIGNYRIVERIGDGGMGTVYRAMDEMLDREVALKVMRPELSRQAALSARFREEAIALARLHHAHIATVFGMERAGDDLALVMEFVRGETLESIVQRSGRVEWSRALGVCAEVLQALDHAHERGVVHRDIKPANIMLDRTGAVKVMDFGIARIMGRTRQTRVGAAVGTPQYMSPEQLRGEDVDGRTDLYSLGAVLFELVTGQVAFEADSDYALMMKQLHESPPALRQFVGDVPEAVERVIARAMAKQRDERFGSAREMREDLRQALHGLPSGAWRPVPPTRLGDVPVAPSATSEPPGNLPATRMASSVQTMSFTPPTRVVSGGGGSSWAPLVKDWRTWSGVAALLLVSAFTIRSLGSDPVDPGPTKVEPMAPRDTAPRPVPGSLGDTSYRSADPSGANPVPPPEARAVDLAPAPPPVEPPPSRVAPSRPAPRPETQRVPAAASSNDAPPERMPPARSTGVEPRPAPLAIDSAPAPPSEDRDAALRAIDGAIRDFAAGVGARQTERIAAVLQADAELATRWFALMREGRLQMNVSAAPEVELSGSRASVRFAATLNIRSEFGANRRRSGQFVAELSRSDGSWRMTSVRPVGVVTLN